MLLMMIWALQECHETVIRKSRLSAAEEVLIRREDLNRHSKDQLSIPGYSLRSPFVSYFHPLPTRYNESEEGAEEIFCLMNE